MAAHSEEFLKYVGQLEKRVQEQQQLIALLTEKLSTLSSRPSAANVRREVSKPMEPDNRDSTSVESGKSEIIERITPLTESPSQFSSSLSSKYQCIFLAPEHKEQLFAIITDSFYDKADLERWIIPELQRDCYVELLEQIWEPLVAARLSFIVKSRAEGAEGKMLGACLNFDALDEPEVTITSKLNTIFEFLEHLEGPIRNTRLPKGKGCILHSFMMGTEKSLNAKDNVEIITAMEEEILRIARDRKFQGILTTNTNPLTQQLGVDVFNYEVLLDYPVNKFTTSDGNRPFGEADTSQRAIVCWKPVSS